MPSRTVELEGHIIDSGMMERCFSIVMEMGGSFEVEEFQIGRHEHEESYCRMEVAANTDGDLEEIVYELNKNGATLSDPSDAAVEPAPADGVVPPDFYSTTNHRTEIRWKGEWIEVENPEMDCAVIVEDGEHEPRSGSKRSSGVSASDAGGASGERSESSGDGEEPRGEPRAYTQVLNGVEAGDRVVTGDAGIRVDPPERPRGGGGAFGFMQGGVSSERPSESLIGEVAEALEDANEADRNVLAVCGPAVIHSGGANYLAALIREGYVDALSAGNGFAVHDVERDIYGTSLGMDVETMEHPREGHKHHIYAISEITRRGGLEAAVEDGVVEDGVMYECIDNDVDYVLAGSIRDDGPLPDTITDAIEAQNAIREQAREADLVLMLSTLLHSVAVGNCLPSSTKVVCVDINPATVTQLLDRGSAQAIGLVTDVGAFLPMLADEVLGEAAPERGSGGGCHGGH